MIYRCFLNIGRTSPLTIVCSGLGCSYLCVATSRRKHTYTSYRGGKHNQNWLYCRECTIAGSNMTCACLGKNVPYLREPSTIDLGMYPSAHYVTLASPLHFTKDPRLLTAKNKQASTSSTTPATSSPTSAASPPPFPQLPRIHRPAPPPSSNSNGT